jgi:hypothetical protein
MVRNWCFFLYADASGADDDYPSDHELAEAQDAVASAQKQYDKLFQGLDNFT